MYVDLFSHVGKHKRYYAYNLNQIIRRFDMPI